MAGGCGGRTVAARAAGLGLALMAIGGNGVHAQSGLWPEPGDRVRISSFEASGEFRVTGLLSEALVLREEPMPDELAIEISSLYGLEVYEGRRSRVWGAMLGGLGGGLAGSLLGVPCGLPHMRCETISPGQRALAGAGLGVLFGLVALGGSELWEEVRLPERPGPALATSGGSEGGAGGPGGSSNPDVISLQELRRVGSQYENAYELVRSSRSSWLNPRSASSLGGADSRPVRALPVVVLNGAPHGDVARLREFAVLELERLEYLAPRDATTRFGLGFDGGAILIWTP